MKIFNFKKIFKSFFYAFQGIIASVKDQSMKVHYLAVITMIFFGIYVNLTLKDWILLVLAMTLVVTAEMINTAIEELADIVRDELNLAYLRTKKLRDIAAGAVIFPVIFALFVAFYLFNKYLL